MSEQEGMAEHGEVRFHNVSDARAKARERIERTTAADVRGYGGRRIGFHDSKAEQKKKEDIERHLVELARRALANRG